MRFRTIRPTAARGGGVLLAAGLVVATAACGSSSNASSTATTTAGSASSSQSASPLSGVTIRFGDIEDQVPKALQAAGLANTPYKIIYSEFPSGTQSFQAMSANKLDEVTVGEETPLVAQADGLSFKILSVGGPKDLQHPEASVSQTAIIVPADSKITSIRQLAGKKIAYTPGSFTQYLLYQTLAKAGIPLKGGFTPVPLPGTAEPAALESGQVDAESVAGTAWSESVVEHGARVLETANGITTNLSFVIANTKSLAKSSAEAQALEDLASRIAKAKQFLATHPAINAQVTESLQKVSAAVAAYSAKYDDVYQYTTQAQWKTAEQWQQTEADNLFKEGIISKPIQVASTFLFPSS